jgi:hypothetical protein
MFKLSELSGRLLRDNSPACNSFGMITECSLPHADKAAGARLSATKKLAL